MNKDVYILETRHCSCPGTK